MTESDGVRLDHLRAQPEFHALMQAMSDFFNATPNLGEQGGVWGRPSLAEPDDFLPLMGWVWRFCALGDCCDLCHRICMPIAMREDTWRFAYRCPDCQVMWGCSWAESVANEIPENLKEAPHG